MCSTSRTGKNEKPFSASWNQHNGRSPPWKDSKIGSIPATCQNIFTWEWWTGVVAPRQSSMPAKSARWIEALKSPGSWSRFTVSARGLPP